MSITSKILFSVFFCFILFCGSAFSADNPALSGRSPNAPDPSFFPRDMANKLPPPTLSDPALVPKTVLGDPSLAPKAVIGQSIFDFGTEHEGKSVVHEFIIKNIGNAPLDITKVSPG
ncbi:MAG: hypothetical protein V1753_01125 [Pseudomonadota bacterium]